MMGAIIGDVAGSYYEVLEIQKKRSYEDRIKIMDINASLFDEKSSVTDDSILTCAVMDCIKNNGDYETYLKEYAKKEIAQGLDMYGRSRFSPGFVKWVFEERKGNSFGSGAAMRISPVGFLYDDLEEVKKEAKKATIPSHNNVEAIKGAECIAVSIYLLRNDFDKEKLKEYIEENYYKLNYDLEDLRHNHRFSSKISNTVPEAIFVFLKSDSFEDSIRKAISIGGDADTIAAITGSLSEVYYGIENKIIEEVKPYLKDYMYDLLKDIYYNNKIIRRSS